MRSSCPTIQVSLPPARLSSVLSLLWGAANRYLQKARRGATPGTPRPSHMEKPRQDPRLFLTRPWPLPAQGPGTLHRESSRYRARPPTAASAPPGVQASRALGPCQPFSSKHLVLWAGHTHPTGRGHPHPCPQSTGSEERRYRNPKSRATSLPCWAGFGGCGGGFLVKAYLS